MRELGDKELVQSYENSDQFMARMNNYSTRPSALPSLTPIPGKIAWEVLRASVSIHKVHPYAKVVPTDQGICSLGTSIETIKGESPIIK